MKRFLLAATAALAAGPALADMTVEIPFIAEIGGVPFSCAGSYTGLGAAKTTAKMLDFRLYAYRYELIAADGTRVPVELEQDDSWQIGRLALLDFEDGSGSCTNGTPQTNTVVRGTVPEGEYRGLEFRVGVPFPRNHVDVTTAPAPLNLTSLFWNWQNGYKFVKIEFAPEGMKEGSRGWLLHLGSTICAAPEKTTPPNEACANPNNILVSLPDFVPGKSTVVIDPAPVVADVDLTQNTPETSPGCMSFPNDPDCNTVLPRLGLAFNAYPAQEQLLVSLR